MTGEMWKNIPPRCEHGERMMTGIASITLDVESGNSVSLAQFGAFCVRAGMLFGAMMPFTFAAPASVVEYIVFYAAPAQVVEYLAPVPLAYAAPVVNATVGFASLPVKPIVSDDDSCCFLRTACSRQHCFHKCRHREICRQGRKCHRGHLFSYKLDRIGGLGVDRSECRERKRWRRTSTNLRLNSGTLWILSSARSRLLRVKWPRTLHFRRRRTTHAT